jgi:hypothetical protein
MFYFWTLTILIHSIAIAISLRCWPLLPT